MHTDVKKKKSVCLNKEKEIVFIILMIRWLKLIVLRHTGFISQLPHLYIDFHYFAQASSVFSEVGTCNEEVVCKESYNRDSKGHGRETKKYLVLTVGWERKCGNLKPQVCFFIIHSSVLLHSYQSSCSISLGKAISLFISI